jgi:hypothetical protein
MTLRMMAQTDEHHGDCEQCSEVKASVFRSFESVFRSLRIGEVVVEEGEVRSVDAVSTFARCTSDCSDDPPSKAVRTSYSATAPAAARASSDQTSFADIVQSLLDEQEADVVQRVQRVRKTEAASENRSSLDEREAETPPQTSFADIVQSLLDEQEATTFWENMASTKFVQNHVAQHDSHKIPLRRRRLHRPKFATCLELEQPSRVLSKQ